MESKKVYEIYQECLSIRDTLMYIKTFKKSADNNDLVEIQSRVNNIMEHIEKDVFTPEMIK